MSPEDEDVEVVSADMDVEDMSAKVVSLPVPAEASVVSELPPDDDEAAEDGPDPVPVCVDDVLVDPFSTVAGDSPHADTATTTGNKHFQQSTPG